MKIEIELPEVEGFEYTGEYRAPKIGESFLDYQGELITFLDGSMDEINPILRKLKPETLEDRVKKEYSDFDVVMLFWAHSVSRSRAQLQMAGCTNPHYVAQSMKGFNGYIYEFDTRFKTNSAPIWPRTNMQPIGSLFSRESK